MDGSFGRFFCGGADFVWSVIRPSGVPSALVIGKAAKVRAYERKCEFKDKG